MWSVSLTDATDQWDLRLWVGSLQQWTFQFTNSDGFTPYPITGATWEYVVHASPADTTKLITVTTTPSTAGVLAVTSTATLSQVQLTLNPAATATMAAGTYYHALWMNPTTTTAKAWFSGQLTLVAVSQP